MEKCLFNGLEEGGTYQLRTTEFITIMGFEEVISDFNKLYEGFDSSSVLFNIVEGEKIKIIADTYTLTFYNEEIDIYNSQEVKSELQNNQISDKTIEIILSMVENEDFSVSNIISYLAMDGQLINIQLTDTLYGNSEFEITS